MPSGTPKNSAANCEDCGTPIVKTCNGHKYCKKCAETLRKKVSNKKYRKTHKEAIAKRKMRDYQTHKEIHVKRGKKYYATHIEDYKKKNAQWRKKNPRKELEIATLYFLFGTTKVSITTKKMCALVRLGKGLTGQDKVKKLDKSKVEEILNHIAKGNTHEAYI